MHYIRTYTDRYVYVYKLQFRLYFILALLVATTPLATATVPGVFTVPLLSLFSASLYSDIDMTGEKCCFFLADSTP